MSKSQWRGIGLILSFALGFLFHEPLSVLRFVTPYSIALMLFLSFIGIERQKLRPERSHIFLLILLQLSWIIAWAIPYLLGYPILAESLFFCAAAPIATASPVIMSLMRGRVEYITTAMLLSHLVFVLVIPLMMPLVLGSEQMSYWELMGMILRQFAFLLLLPCIIVVLTRYFIPNSKQWGKRCGSFSLMLWMFNLTIISAAGLSNILSMQLTWSDIYPLALGAALVCATSFLLGYRLGRPHLCKEFSQGLGQKNNILILYIASQAYAHPLAYVAPAFYVIFHNIANAIQIMLAAKRERDVQG